MQILVLYYSKGGNTRKLAQAIAEGVDAVEGVSAPDETAAENGRKLGRRVAELALKLHG